jgi:DNA-binding NarL/FixJ family response regulator
MQLSKTNSTFRRLPRHLRQTLGCLLEGASEKEAAARLGLSWHTVHGYIKALHRRFGVRSRAELLVLCLRRGGRDLVRPP